MIDTGIPNISVDITPNEVTINDKVKLIKPVGVSVTQWEQFWERLDKDHSNDKDGYVVVNLGD